MSDSTDKTACPQHGKTLPMTMTADDCLSMTLAWLSSRLPQADTEFLQKAMTLYGDLRARALSKDGE